MNILCCSFAAYCAIEVSLNLKSGTSCTALLPLATRCSGKMVFEPLQRWWSCCGRVFERLLFIWTKHSKTRKMGQPLKCETEGLTLLISMCDSTNLAWKAVLPCAALTDFIGQPLSTGTSTIWQAVQHFSIRDDGDYLYQQNKPLSYSMVSHRNINTKYPIY